MGESQKSSYRENLGSTYNLVGARYYDADIGLWTSVDPMREYWSGYTYVGNDPVNAFDPDGNSTYRFYGNWILSDGHAEPFNSPTNHSFLAVVDDETGQVVKTLTYTGAWSEELGRGKFIVDDPVDIEWAQQSLNQGWGDLVSNDLAYDVKMLQTMELLAGTFGDYDMFWNNCASKCTEVESRVHQSLEPKTHIPSNDNHSSGDVMENRCISGGC